MIFQFVMKKRDEDKKKKDEEYQKVQERGGEVDYLLIGR